MTRPGGSPAGAPSPANRRAAQLALAVSPSCLPTTSVHLAAHSAPQRLAHSTSTTSLSALLRAAISASDGLTSFSFAGGPTEQGPVPVLQAMPSVLSFSTIAQDISSSFLNSA